VTAALASSHVLAAAAAEIGTRGIWLAIFVLAALNVGLVAGLLTWAAKSQTAGATPAGVDALTSSLICAATAFAGAMALLIALREFLT
jgi:hypothetical protein